MTFAHLELGMGNGQAFSQLLGAEIGMKKTNSQLWVLGMGMKNSVPNPTWEKIAKRVSGKSWEQKFPLTPSLLVLHH